MSYSKLHSLRTFLTQSISTATAEAEPVVLLKDFEKIFFPPDLHCVSKNASTLKWYSSKLHGWILMTFDRNIQKTLE